MTDDTLIYVPDTGYACYTVLNGNVIRAYETTPEINTTLHYRDYYINSHYIYNDHYEIIDTVENLPVCIGNDKITNYYSYRNDITDILLCFFILLVIGYFITSSIVKALFRRKKVF